MRWVILSDDWAPQVGGVATWGAAAAAGLRAAGDQVSVFARARPELIEARGVGGPSFGRWGGVWLARAAWGELEAADRVLATTWPVATALAATSVATRLWVVGHGSDLTSPAAPWRAWVWRRAERRGVVSRFLAGLAPAQTEVLPAPVDAGPPRVPPRALKTLMMVARGVESKGGDRFVRLVHAAKLDGVVVGDGPARGQWQALAAHLGARVRFVGSVPASWVPGLLASADAAVLLPRRRKDGGEEGLGLCLLEAAAVGVPAVGCRIGGVPEAVGPGLILEEPDAPARAAEALRAWWRPDRGEEARQALLAQHGVHRLAAQLRAVG